MLVLVEQPRRIKSTRRLQPGRFGRFLTGINGKIGPLVLTDVKPTL